MAVKPVNWNWRIGLIVLLLHGQAAAGSVPAAIAFHIGGSADTIPESFDYQALSVRFRLPWQDEWGNWQVATHLDFGAARLESNGTPAGLFTAGPSATFSRGRLLLDLGIQPGALSRDHINGREFGGWFQFTSHIGLYWQIDRRWRIGYRLQHTSNGRLYTHNDGLDIQTVNLWIGF